MGFQLTTLVVIGSDCIGSYKSNYYMTTMAPAIMNSILQALDYVHIYIIYDTSIILII